jgi:hypothetical protein
MRRFGSSLLFLFLLSLFPVFGVVAQTGESTGVEITSPETGTALQGIVAIIGNTELGGFISFEVTFGYASDTTGTWFLIAEGEEPVDNNLLAEWDTTTLTDGQYNLRLTVFQQDGRREHFIVHDLRIRNYSPIETHTPTPTITTTPSGDILAGTDIVPTITPTGEIKAPTPTSLPQNPLEISGGDISNSLLRGIAGAFALFLLAGLYISIQRLFRR